MGNKSAQSITAAEVAELNRLQEAEERATNAKNRAELALGSARQDRVEFFQNLQRKYRLRDEDRVDTGTGAITRAMPGAPPPVPSRGAK